MAQVNSSSRLHQHLAQNDSNVPNVNQNGDILHSGSMVAGAVNFNSVRTPIKNIPLNPPVNGLVSGVDDVNGNMNSALVNASPGSQNSRQSEMMAANNNRSLPIDTSSFTLPQRQLFSSTYSTRGVQDGYPATSHQGSSAGSAPPVRRREASSAKRHDVRRNNTVSGVTREAGKVFQRYLEHRSNSQIETSRSSSLPYHQRKDGQSGLKYSTSDRYPMLPIDECDSVGHVLRGVDDGMYNTTSDEMSSTFNSLDTRERDGSSRADTLDSSIGRNSSRLDRPSTVDEATGSNKAEGFRPDDLSHVLARLPGSQHKRKPSAGLSTLADSSARGSLTPSEEDTNGFPKSSSVDGLQQRKKPVLQRIKERFRASFRRKKPRPAVTAPQSVNGVYQGDKALPSQSEHSQTKSWGSSFRKSKKVDSRGKDERLGVSRAASSSTNGSAAQETVSEHGTHSTINRARASAVDTSSDKLKRDNESGGVFNRFRKSLRIARRKSVGKNENSGKQSQDLQSSQTGSAGRKSSHSSDDRVVCHGLSAEDQALLDKHRDGPSDGPFLRPQIPVGREEMDTSETGRRIIRHFSQITTDGGDEPDTSTNQAQGSDVDSSHHTGHAPGPPLKHQTSKKFGDKSVEEKEELYDMIASRLQEMGDDLVMSSPAVQAALLDGDSCQVAVAAADRTDGMEISVRINNTGAVPQSPLGAEGEHITLLQQLANAINYDSFSQLVGRAVQSSGDQLAQQIAMLYRITTDAIELAGASTVVAERLSHMAMIYFEQTMASRLVDAGGWESVVEDSSLESEVD